MQDKTGAKGPRKFIDVDGIRTSYFEAGAGEDMVLVHGGHFGSPSTANSGTPQASVSVFAAQRIIERHFS